MTPQDRMCLCKRRYNSPEEIEAALAALKKPYPMRGYKCPYCKHWHLTKGLLWKEKSA